MTARKPGQRTMKMPIGMAVRCVAMDCEATRPIAAMLVWQGEDGRLHKRVLPSNQVLEDGLLSAVDRLPPGCTKPEGAVLS